MKVVEGLTGVTSFQHTHLSDTHGFLIKMTAPGPPGLGDLSQPLNDVIAGNVTISLVRNGNSQTVCSNIPLGIFAAVDGNGEGVLPASFTGTQLDEITFLVPVGVGGSLNISADDQFQLDLVGLDATFQYDIYALELPVSTDVLNKVAVINIQSSDTERNFDLSDVRTICFDRRADIRIERQYSNGDVNIHYPLELDYITARTNELMASEVNHKDAQSIPTLHSHYVFDVSTVERIRFFKDTPGALNLYLFTEIDIDSDIISERVAIKNAGLVDTLNQ